jgi:hypothetical protein
MTRKATARIIVAVLLGFILGVAVGRRAAHEAARGRDLTLKAYVDNFEGYKKELAGQNVPMVAAVIMGVLAVVLCLGVYELLVLGVDRALAALDRRRDVAAQPGTPPPW